MGFDGEARVGANFFAVVREAESGRVVGRRKRHNVTTNAGLNLIRDFLHGDAVTGDLSHFALGIGGAAASVGDIALSSEVLRAAWTEVAKGAGELTLNYYLPSGSGNGQTLREAGIFNAAEGGTLFARTLFDPIEKSGLVTVTFTWQVRLG